MPTLTAHGRNAVLTGRNADADRPDLPQAWTLIGVLGAVTPDSDVGLLPVT